MKIELDFFVDGFENAIISENNESWFVDLRTGMGRLSIQKLTLH